MVRPSVRSAALLVIGTAILATAVTTWDASSTVRAEDRNHDGRPDLWRTYDARGTIVEVAIDTNFDGAADVEERYRDGDLVERDLDRDFDRRVDVAQTFDPVTHQIVRSVVDVDDDGVSDLLVLFQDGRPVYSNWAATPHAVQRGRNAGDIPAATVAPLRDFFREEAAARAARSSSSEELYARASTIRGLLSGAAGSSSPPASASRLRGRDLSSRSRLVIPRRLLRGPPRLALLG